MAVFDSLISSTLPANLAELDWTEGDFNLDGQVTFADFLILSGNFGAGANRPSAIQVPEPNAGLLIVTGIVGLLHWRRFA